MQKWQSTKKEAEKTSKMFISRFRFLFTCSSDVKLYLKIKTINGISIVGANRFCSDIQMMRGTRPSLLLRIIWVFVIPVFIGVMYNLNTIVVKISLSFLFRFLNQWRFDSLRQLFIELWYR
jgi:hypothetical protein